MNPQMRMMSYHASEPYKDPSIILNNFLRALPHYYPIIHLFFSDENLSKLCAEGAIQNLLSMLHFLPEDMIFWGEFATSDLLTLMKSLNESYVPKAVLKPSLGIDSIQKCLWILRKKFKFQTTKN
jgi:hypothetical protein